MFAPLNPVNKNDEATTAMTTDVASGAASTIAAAVGRDWLAGADIVSIEG